jgi:hypothetical protein
MRPPTEAAYFSLKRTTFWQVWHSNRCIRQEFFESKTTETKTMGLAQQQRAHGTDSWSGLRAASIDKISNPRPQGYACTQFGRVTAQLRTRARERTLRLSRFKPDHEARAVPDFKV